MYKNRILSTLFVIPTVSLFCSGLAFAEEHKHRQHDSHEHGVVQLNIAREGKTLQIEITSPAMNIVGFEHAPRTEQEHNAIKQAVAKLKDIKKLFVLSPAANCKIVQADVGTSLIADEHATIDMHGRDEHEHASQHTDFYVEYSFKCPQMSALTSMEVGLFVLFPATEDIDVKLLTEKGQTALELNAKMTRINF